MLKPLLLLLLSLPTVCFSQFKITGKVVDKRHKNPVANARVFLDKDTTKYKTDADGAFSITNVKPGEYVLVVSSSDYETYANTLIVYDNNVVVPDINLLLLDELDVVNNKYYKDRERDLSIFKEVFLGRSDNAKQCTILNPDVIFVKYNKLLKKITAFSDEDIEIENKALGYLIKYKLSIFYYRPDGSAYIDGTSAFEELKGSDSDKKRWKKQRQTAYFGSSMHFFRSVVGNQVEEEGFKVLKLTRKPNPDYNTPGYYGLPYIQTLYKDKPLLIDSLVHKTDKIGTFALSYTDCLYIIYTKKHDRTNVNAINLPAYAPPYATTIITFNEQYAFFGVNGIINPQSIVTEGAWAAAGIATVLPANYFP
ncbi:beta-sandwich domain-containing protein [Mucilaginibacter sp. AW1-7]|jgi:hypothetical protein|uniref:beta-sandwich domain-containing protein n=1 Tax=Mucilaginibacter sp. AW1-7 TaxID=3349874 RepID=UPI003F740A2B